MVGGRRDPGDHGPDDAALAQRYEEHGYDGLYDYRKQQPSPKRVPMATLEKVLHLYREKYYDFNVRHFHEKQLVEEHQIDLSYTWVKLGAARSRIGSEAEASGRAPEAAAATSVARHAAAH